MHAAALTAKQRLRAAAVLALFGDLAADAGDLGLHLADILLELGDAHEAEVARLRLLPLRQQFLFVHSRLPSLALPTDAPAHYIGGMI